MRGKFIVIEGADGFGKSTQIRGLVEHLRKIGEQAEEISFPNYDAPTGKLIDLHLKDQVRLAGVKRFVNPMNFRHGVRVGGRSDEDSLMFQCIHVADKYAAVNKIEEWLESGIHVICGRWWQSAYVYGFDDGLDADWIRQVYSCLPRADLNILLELSEEETLIRRPDMRDRYEKNRDKQGRIRRHYHSLWSWGEKNEGGRWEVVSASGTVEEVRSRLLQAIDDSLALPVLKG